MGTVVTKSEEQSSGTDWRVGRDVKNITSHAIPHSEMSYTRVYIHVCIILETITVLMRVNARFFYLHESLVTFFIICLFDNYFHFSFHSRFEPFIDFFLISIFLSLQVSCWNKKESNLVGPLFKSFSNKVRAFYFHMIF